jgi:hypothetical protein
MSKIYKILAFLLIIFYTTASNSHVQHYDNLNRIEFDIFRNDKHIGKHIFTFKRLNDQLSVESKIKFEIKKFGAVLYKYYANGTEVFKNGEFIKFSSNTKQNKKDKYVNLKLENNEYLIDGSSFKGVAPVEYVLGTWWDHSIVDAPAQISAVSGRIIKQKVVFVGKEKINIGNKTYNTLHFNFLSTDKKLAKGKRLNTHIWYEENTLNWVKASFDKKGKWEYRLLSIK